MGSFLSAMGSCLVDDGELLGGDGPLVALLCVDHIYFLVDVVVIMLFAVSTGRHAVVEIGLPPPPLSPLLATHPSPSRKDWRVLAHALHNLRHRLLLGMRPGAVVAEIGRQFGSAGREGVLALPHGPLATMQPFLNAPPPYLSFS